ncbi:MAG: cytochrome c [Bacteroidota bacterium]|nr:cytochrome c [Bacteroidota bacterium]MDP3145854.1 cytochrome c [Bacteroidota bacterium]MDP3558488.1 cytochrome c [Bacteroidota bacterium]
MKKVYILLIFSCMLLLTTCISDISSPNACFNEDVLPIFISNCTYAGCHNATEKKADYNLTSYEAIMKGITPKHPLQSEIYNTIKGSNPSMPQTPYPMLSKKDVYTIKTWIQMGARNTSNCKTCDTTNFTYGNRISTTLQTWCVGCHNSNNLGGGFDLSNYNGAVSAAENNKLLGSIKHLSGFSAMPKNGAQLSICEISAIEKWINKGFPQ